MLGFLHEATEVDGPQVFTEPVLAAFHSLIPRTGACNVWVGLDPNADPERRTVYDFDHVEAEWCVDVRYAWTEEDDEICRMLVARDEVVPPYDRNMRKPLRFTDVLSPRELHSNELWQIGKHKYGEEQVWLWLPGPERGVLRRISFCSDKLGQIEDREVRILELLTPHLVRLYRRAYVRRGRVGATGLTPREHEIMWFVGDGKTNEEIARILWVSPHTVRKHLENVFEKLEVTNRTAAAARVFGSPGRRPTANGHSGR
jgi:DNA-binding CsgD family transcriptional regulator